jgi:alpha-beta hydrolase superfamily lysophospholipase
VSDPVTDFGTTRDGLIQLRCRWAADTTARGAVLIVHGMSEHSGRYDHVARRLNGAGFHVVAFDHRGHGRSSGDRTHVERFAEYVDDVADHLAVVAGLGLPTAVVGHSLGGLITLCHAVSDRPQSDAYVLSGPALGHGRPAWETAITPFADLVAPRVFLPTAFDATMLSHDPEVVRAYEEDPLIRSGATPRFGAEVLAAMEQARSRLDQLRRPVLVVHGADDEIVPAASSRVLEQSPFVDRLELPGMRHEVFNEVGGAAVLDRVVSFLELELV